MRTLALFCLASLAPSLAYGQSTRMLFEVYGPGGVVGTAAPIGITVIGPTEITCGRTSDQVTQDTASGTTVTGTTGVIGLPAPSLHVVWDDPASTGQFCDTTDVSAKINAAAGALPAGTYAWAGSIISTAALPMPPTFTKPADGACTPLPGKKEVLAITVGTWTATVRAGAGGTVGFRLSNRWPVTTVVARLDGVDAGALTASDLTSAGGLWFTAPTKTGTYNLTLYARDLAGCEYKTGLIRTVFVVAQ